ncbi:hypothetical protein BH24ACT3_BH24ACT3_13580 [soil metagenome]
MSPADEPMGTLRAAVDPAELDELWAAVGFDGPLPDVDFEQRVVISVTIPDDACPFLVDLPPPADSGSRSSEADAQWLRSLRGRR